MDRLLIIEKVAHNRCEQTVLFAAAVYAMRLIGLVRKCVYAMCVSHLLVCNARVFSRLRKKWEQRHTSRRAW